MDCRRGVSSFSSSHGASVAEGYTFNFEKTGSNKDKKKMLMSLAIRKKVV